MKRLTLLAPILCLLLASGTTYAQDDGEHFRSNRIAVKLGGHHEDGEDDPLYGLYYAHWFGERLGVSVAYDYVDTDILSREQALVVSANLRFAERWKLSLGPGIEYVDTDLPGADDDNDEFLFRVGLGVELELGRSGWFLEPAAEIDLLRNEEKIFLGVLVGKAF